MLEKVIAPRDDLLGQRDRIPHRGHRLGALFSFAEERLNGDTMLQTADAIVVSVPARREPYGSHSPHALDAGRRRDARVGECRRDWNDELPRCGDYASALERSGIGVVMVTTSAIKIARPIPRTKWSGR